MTNIFLDTEFTGLHQLTNLLSIGLVSDCGKTFYAEFDDYDRLQINEWLQENVISNLCLTKMDNLATLDCWRLIADTPAIKDALTIWLAQFEKIEVWSDCLSYDWVLFNQIFGHAFKLPENILYIPFDICTLFKVKGIDPDINREVFAADAFTENNEPLFFDEKGLLLKIKKHNSLWDAEIIKRCYLKAIKLP